MDQMRKDDLVKNLVRLLLKSDKEKNNQGIQIDDQTFNQLLLYILMKEVLNADKEVIEEHLLLQLDEVMADIQKECDEILTLLQTKG